MKNIPSYPSIYNLGHRAIDRIFDGPVLVEEKLDGSQFSFGVFDDELFFRSKNQRIHPEAPPKMFQAGVEYICSIVDQLCPNCFYRGEYFSKPKHNTLVYERIPKHNIIIFDTDNGMQHYQSPAEKLVLATELDLEVVPVLFEGKVDNIEEFQELLKTQSILGGTIIEGVVVKRYDAFTVDKKAMMGKYVREDFKEQNQKNWKGIQMNVIDKIIAEYTTEARWVKAIHARRDRDELLDAPQDIGPLLKAISLDLLAEEKEAIMERLFKDAWPRIAKAVTNGFPQWYKDRLLELAFIDQEILDTETTDQELIDRIGDC